MTRSRTRDTAGDRYPDAIAMHSALSRRAGGRLRPCLARLLRTLWQKGLLPEPDLAALPTGETIREEVRSGAPAPQWPAALECLIGSLRDEARLNEIGVTFAYVQLSRLLRQRIDAARLWREHSHILAVPVEKPVIVLGQMRSGTTRLQRLLACDERFSHPRFFEVMSPLPGRRPDLRRAASWAQLGLLNFLNPELHRIHPTSPSAAEEVFGLLSFSLYGAHFEAQWRVPRFARFWEEQDRAWVYRELKLLLRTIAWQRGGDTKPWVLKAPQFMEDLDALLAAFPDARLVCLHRDPAAVVASTASLVWNQMALQSDHADRDWIGREWLRKTARRQGLCAAARAARPDVPQIDVEFDAMNGDWRREMRRIYAFLGLELTPAVERRMASYLGKAERSGFRRHGYRLEDYGLDHAAVRNVVGA